MELADLPGVPLIEWDYETLGHCLVPRQIAGAAYLWRVQFADVREGVPPKAHRVTAELSDAEAERP